MNGDCETQTWPDGEVVLLPPGPVPKVRDRFEGIWRSDEGLEWGARVPISWRRNNRRRSCGRSFQKDEKMPREVGRPCQMARLGMEFAKGIQPEANGGEFSGD